MSKAEELLDSLSIEDIQPFTSEPDIEGHIVIDKDRIIHVPTELKRIAVQYDSNIETVTFDCPRYWDEHDLSEMNIYINYKLPGNLINNIGQSLVKNLRINEDDENIINFDWTIGPILTNNKGNLPFSVCAKSKTNQDSDEAIRWYSEINTELTISEGMDGSGDIEDNYEDLFPDVINDIISKLEGINATYDEKLEAFNTNATSKTESFDTNAETKTTEFNNNATTKTNEFNSNAIEKTEAFNTNANGVLKKSNAFINGLMNAALTNEVEGVENVINDGIECPLFKMEVDGHTNEQVVTQGYNLIGVNDVEETTKNGLTYSIKNGLLKLNGTANALVPLGNILFNIPAEAGKYRFEIFPQNGTWKSGWLGVRGYIDGTQKWYQQIAKTNNTNYVINDRTVEELDGCNRCDIYVASGSTFDNFGCYIQLKKGAEHSPYEPYSNGIPSPSPDYEQPINSIEGSLEFACRGKSLFGGITLNITREGITFDTKKDGSVYAKGTALNRSLSLFSSEVSNNLIEINPGIYTISGGSKNASVELITDAGTLIASTSTLEPFSTQINIEESKKVFLRVSVEKGKSINETLYPMLIKGSNNSNWEPYVEPNEVTFNLNGEKLRSVGDVKDELIVDLSTGDYYKVENVGEVVFDGSDDEIIIKRSDVTTPNVSCFRIENFDYTLIRDLIGMCNYFIYDTELKNIKDTFRFVKSPGYAIQFCIEDNLASNSDEFRTWLSTHNTIVDYVLQKPTTKKLGTLDADQLLKLATLKGYNYMTVTGIVDGELVNLNSRITYIQNANDYREIQNGKIAKMISNHPKQSMEGIDNTFDDAVDMELFELGGDGKSEQVVTTGKNKYYGTSDKYTFTPSNNSWYDVYGNKGISGTNLGDKTIYKAPVNHGKQYTFSASIKAGSNLTNMQLIYDDETSIKTQSGSVFSEHTFTASKDGYVICRMFINSGEGITVSNVQLEEGSVATEYEPYTGGQPSPSPDYPQEITTLTFDKITRCGKNLATENFANQNNSINLARTLKKGEKITIVVNMTATDNPLSGYGINIYDQDNEQLWGNSYTNWQEPYDGWNSFVVTVKNDTSRLRINSYGYQEIEILTAVLSGALVVENKYVNDGSLYEPYQGQSYDVDLQGNEMVELPNGVKDELVIDKQGNISLIKNTGKAILTGSENWKDDWQTSTTPDYIQFYLSADFLNNNYIQSTLRNVLVNRFKVDGSVWINSKEILALNNDVKYSLQIKMLRSRVSDLASFKEWLSTHNVIMYYQLARLQTIPLGTLSELITTLNGTNNISINGNIPTTISTTYGLDIKKYVDNEIAELSAQMIKGE